MAQNDNMLPIGTKLHGGVYEIIKHLSNGAFGNTYVVKNVSFDESMPRWSPGMQIGSAVRVKSTVMVSFRL